MHTAATHTQIQTSKFAYNQEWLVANFKLKSFTKTRPAVKLNSRSRVSSNFVLPKIVGLQHFADESVCLSMRACASIYLTREWSACQHVYRTEKENVQGEQKRTTHQ